MSDGFEFFANDLVEKVIVEGDPAKAGENRIVVRRTQDIEPFIEANKRERDATPEIRKFSGRDMAKVAEIPNVIVEKWMQEGFNILDPSPETQKELRRRLDLAENEWMKTLKVGLSRQSRGRR